MSLFGKNVDGQTPTGGHLIQGKDSNGKAQDVSVDTDGVLQINLAASDVSIGGGTQYTEDAAAAANPVGNAPILVRKDTPATVTSDDGDNVAQRGTNYGAAYVQVVDSSGNYVDTFGGGTQYTEDAAAAANPAGNALILVREDGRAGSLTTTDGDNVAARGNNKGELYVKTTDSDALLTTIDTDTGGIATSTASIDTKTPALGQALAAASVPVVLTAAQITTLTPVSTVTVTGVSTLAEQQTQTTHLATIAGDTTDIEAAIEIIDNAIFVDDADFTDGTSSGIGIMAVAEGTPTTVTDGDMGMVAMTTDKRALKVSVVDALPAGSAAIGKLAANSGVDIGDVDVTSCALPTGAATAANQQTDALTDTQLRATAVPVSGTVAVTGVATAANQTTIIGHVDGIETLIGTTNTNTAATTTALQIMDDWDNGASDGASVSGDVAHDTADAGEPVKIGGKAVSAEITPVTANDRVNASFDLTGKQIVLPYANPENFVSALTSAMTGTTSTITLAAPAAGLRNYITQITVSNSHATVSTLVSIQDGNGGSAFYSVPAAAVYGGATLTFPTPLRQPTTATAVYVACVTTGSSTIVSISGYKGA